ncbi:MAG TPA: hypothetical protein PKJ24_01415, partial [Prolixibacteraceae bacterium]|nr:hypothetical protein [Prolixibacteraceae bacterium]
ICGSRQTFSSPLPIQILSPVSIRHLYLDICILSCYSLSHFTVFQMNEIYEMLFAKPINKDAVMIKLKAGKMEGGPAL